MNRLEQKLNHKIEARRASGNLRKLTVSRADVDFYSNDYLGFATNNIIGKLVREQFPGSMGTGATGSRLLSGNSVQLEALEAQIATFHGAEAALVFNSGYDANTGLVAAITDRHTVILYDELCHASILDGVRLSISEKTYKFRHNDVDHLQEKLAKLDRDAIAVVIVESVYSMDGDQAPLFGLVDLCEKFGAQLIVDEAHATGVFGDKGQGLVFEKGLQARVFARVHTFGKALGCQGATVVGSSLLKQYLINFARPFIYSTAPAPATISAIVCAYQHLLSDAFSPAPIHELIQYFNSSPDRASVSGWAASNSPIQVFLNPEEQTTTFIATLATLLQQSGLQVNAILSPTVPSGKERLRVCLHTFNTKSEIDRLLGTVRSVFT